MSEPTLIAGKTLNKLELSNVTADMNGKKFTVVVKSQYGSVSSTGTLKVGSSPVISKHPVSVIGGLNVKIDFSVTVSGTEPLKYQWRKNGQNISGATQAIFSINSATLNDSGDYDVVVTNDFGTVYSQTAKFIAGNRPVITTQPKSSVSLVGSETVSVVATGTAPLTYQWFKDTVAISGATSSSYNITSDGTYKVIVSNQVGSVTSTDCVVGAVIAPRIITQPFGTTTPALLKVVATGTSLTYKWYKNGVEISGQTQDSYIANDAGTYKVVVSNAADSVTSNDVTLITVQPPLITLQPVGGNLYDNTPLNLSVTATGTAPLTYQWYKDDVLIAGATSSTYNATEEGEYKVYVSNASGTVLSNFVNVTNVIPPSITTQPVGGNTPLNLSVVAAGTTPLTYQWYKDDVLIGGATSSTYYATQAGTYKVVVTNSAGNITSTSVNVITITRPTITTQPVGGNTPKLLEVVATGTTPLTYQWYKDDAAISGATSSSYNATLAGTYKVTVSNSAGNITSTSVNVITITRPTITTQPVGGNTPKLLEVVATGTTPLTYQWYKDNVLIGGATSSTYNATQAGTYKVTVTNSAGSDTSTSVNVIATNSWQQLGMDIDGEATSDRSGWSVSMNAVGDRVAIGAIWNDGNGTQSGQVRIYQSNGTAWTQLGIDIDGEDTYNNSGCSVSMNAVGDRVAIGAYGNYDKGTGSGQVRIYRWNGTSWGQLGSDINGEATGDNSGYSVSMNAVGDRVAIGAPRNDGNGTTSGQVRIYQWNGTAWTRLGIDIDGEAADDWSGYSVSMNAVGDRVAIGAYGNDGNGTDRGHVRIYQWNGKAWTQLGSDIDGEATGDYSGYSVSMNASGDRVAIGAYGNDGNDTTDSQRGHVRIYQWNGTAWTQLGIDIDGEAAVDQSGISVSMNAVGDRVAIGAPYNDGNDTTDNQRGHVRIYQWTGTAWTQLGMDIDGEAGVDFSGWSVSMNAVGDRVAIGAYNNDGNDGNWTNSGQVRIYQIPQQ